MQELGPYSGVQVMTVGVGVTEINDLLSQGWRIIAPSMHEQMVATGSGSRQRVVRWVPMAFMGRAIATEEDASRVREQASEQGDDAIAVAGVSLRDPGEPEDEANEDTPADIPPLTISQDISEQPERRGPGRPRRVDKGVGTFEASGIRG